MAKSDAEPATTSAAGGAASTPRRINVAVTPDMLRAIDHVIDREGVTLTEAVRRLISYGDVMYRAVRDNDQTVFFRDEDGREREVLMV